MTSSSEYFDAIIIGGGAAGLMCAIEASQLGQRVLLLEHSDRVGKKIRISGGGRCNFTNLNTDPNRFISQNPRFCYSALARYTPRDFLDFVERHGIAWHEKKLGQLFCDESAQLIIDALVADATAAGAEIRVGCTVESVEKPDGFRITTSQGEVHAAALVVATGGLSIPKLGASDLGYRIASQFGVPIVETAPALVPLTLSGEFLDSFSELSGNSFPARVTFGKTSFDESVLVTHKGLSGPAILQISSYWRAGEPIRVNLFPDTRLDDELLQQKRDKPTTQPAAILRDRVMARFAKRLCDHYGWTKPLGEMTDKNVRALASALQDWRIPIHGTEGYAKAEVTRGGVDTKALTPKTMEVRDVPGLYFIGEVMDVTGWLGGYNFQWAWASAVAAGRALGA